MTTRIWNYAAKRPNANQASVNKQMGLAHRYRNRLVKIELDRRHASEQAIRKYFPELLKIEAAIDQQSEQKKELLRRRNAERDEKKRRKKQPVDELIASISQTIYELRERVNTIRGLAYSAPKATYSNDPMPANAIAGPELKYECRGTVLKIWKTSSKGTMRLRKKAIGNKPNPGGGMSCEIREFASDVARECYIARMISDATANVSIKQARAKSGLYCGNYQIVEQESMGTGTPPKFHAANGDGHLSVQIQGGVDAGDNHKMLSISGNGRKRDAIMRVDTGEDGKPIYATIPFSMRRELPEESKVMWGHMIRRKVGYMSQWNVQFACRADESVFTKKDLASKGACGVDIGWRMTHRGLRCGYWVGSDGDKGEILIPTDRLNSWQAADGTRSIRDLNFNEILSALDEWRKKTELPPWFIKHITTFERDEKGNISFDADGNEKGRIAFAQWKSKARLRGLIQKWRSNRFDADKQPFRVFEFFNKALKFYPGLERNVFGAADAWEKREAHLWNWEASKRKRLQAWRKDLFRQTAVMLREKYSTIVVEKMDLRPLCRKEAQGSDETSLNRTRAACGELREILKNCDAKIIVHEAKNSTRKCNQCGHINKWKNSVELMQRCGECGNIFDQDENAAKNLLNVASASVVQ